jgi:hypothetical protein
LPRLANILNDSDELSIETPDGDITVEYYPSRLTQKVISQMQHYSKIAQKAVEDEAKQKEVLGKMYDLLLSFFKSWDLEDEAACGKCEGCREAESCKHPKIITLPLTAETLDSLPFWLLTDITNAFVNPNRSAPQKKKKKS